MWVELIKLTTLLLAFTLLLTFLFQRLGKESNYSKLLQGALFGLIAVAGMTMPVHFIPGVIFDPRSVLVSVAGLFGGPFMAIPASIIAGGYRLSLGGAGALAGALVVLLSGATGIAAYYFRKHYQVKINFLSLYVFGLICHIVAVSGLFVLPKDIMWEVIKNLSIPFFVLYPPLTVFLGCLINSISLRFETEQKLVASNAQLRAIFDGSSDLMWLKDKKGRYQMCNKQFERHLGVVESEVKGKTDFDFVDEYSASSFSQSDMQAIDEHRVVRNEGRFISADDGRHVFLETIKTPVFDENGNFIGLLGVSRDITQRAEIEAKLRQSAVVFESTSEGVVITDNNSIILDVNCAFSEITGYERSEVIGQNTSIISSGRHDRIFYEKMWNSLNSTGRWKGEIWNRRKNGSVYPEWLTITAVNNERGELTNYIAVFSDISSIKDAHDKLDFLAYHDALTGLPNRLLLNERLEASISRAARHNSKLAILFIDLDRFKNINDSFGHKAGDDLLQYISSGLKNVTRKEDLVARISGDEFIIVLEDIDEPDSIIGPVNKIMDNVSSSITIEGHNIHPTVSIGISLFPMDGDNVIDLISNADAAMYRAKGEGRNNYQFYTRDLTEKALARVVIENELREALSKGEFVLFYQPQIELTENRIVGLEALLRWKHSKRGLVPPDQFIHLAEDSGLINPIGEWVIYEATRQGKQWLDDGIDFGSIAVNVSSVQINKNELVEIVSKALAHNTYPPSSLELEVTEGAIMKRTASVIEQMHDLRNLGIKLSIDDFGTGFSSLSYLKQLPVTKLKIDQSFVRGLPEDSNNREIVDAVIRMGKGLGLTLIAEGVEVIEQEAFLKKMKCDEVQGYLYSRPLEADEIEKYLISYDSKGIS